MLPRTDDQQHQNPAREKLYQFHHSVKKWKHRDWAERLAIDWFGLFTTALYSTSLTSSVTSHSKHMQLLVVNINGLHFFLNDFFHPTIFFNDFFHPTTTSWLCRTNRESRDWRRGHSSWHPSPLKRVCAFEVLTLGRTVCVTKQRALSDWHFTHPLGYNETCSLLLLGECWRRNKSLCLLFNSNCALLLCSNSGILSH